MTAMPVTFLECLAKDSMPVWRYSVEVRGSCGVSWYPMAWNPRLLHGILKWSTIFVLALPIMGKIGVLCW